MSFSSTAARPAILAQPTTCCRHSVAEYFRGDPFSTRGNEVKDGFPRLAALDRAKAGRQCWNFIVRKVYITRSRPAFFVSRDDKMPLSGKDAKVV
jgi:hypothetical protein